MVEEERIIEVGTGTVKLLEVMIKGMAISDVPKNTARLYRKFFEALIAEGFSSAEAFEIIKSMATSGIHASSNR